MSATSRCTPSKMSDWFVSSNEATRRSIWRASSCESESVRARRGEHWHAEQVNSGNQRACDCARYPRRTRWRRADEMRWSALVLAVGLPTALRTALPLLPAEVPAGGRRVGLSALLAAGLASGEVASGEAASGEVASGEVARGGPSVVKAAAFSWPSPAVSDGL